MFVSSFVPRGYSPNIQIQKTGSSLVCLPGFTPASDLERWLIEQAPQAALQEYSLRRISDPRELQKRETIDLTLDKMIWPPDSYSALCLSSARWENPMNNSCVILMLGHSCLCPHPHVRSVFLLAKKPQDSSESCLRYRSICQ